jgi:hypothetical protein
MNEFHDLLHVARPNECNVQQMTPPGIKPCTARQGATALKAASMLVLERNRMCRARAGMRPNNVQQTLVQNTSFVAPEFPLAGQLAELNGLIARVARLYPAEAGDRAALCAIGIREIDAVLRSFRALAAGVPISGLPATVTHIPESRDER